MPDINRSERNLPTGTALSEQDRRQQSIALITNAVIVLSVLSTLGFTYLLTVQPGWQLGVLAGINLLTAGAGIVANLVFYPRKQFFQGLVVLGLVFGIAASTMSASLAGLGIPAALVFLILTLVISSTVDKEWQANLILGMGILVSGACALLAEFSPIDKLSILVMDVFTPAVLAFVFLVFVVMLTTQFVMATMRIRLVTAFLVIVIIPLSVLSTIQSRFMFDVLNDEVRESLNISAQQTALRIDSFFEESQRSTNQVARLDSLVKYLEIDPDQRAGSPQEVEAWRSLDIVAAYEFDHQAYRSSYGLIDMEGNTLYDTLYRFIPPDSDPSRLEEIGITPHDYRFEGDQTYFLVAARSGVPFVSPLHITSRSHSYFFISSPVKNTSGQTIGVVRARLDGQLLQNLIEQYSHLLGNQSYALLLDENNIRLADAFTPAYLYKSIVPLPKETVKILQENVRLPRLPEEELSTDFPDFDAALNNYLASPFFSAELSPINQESEDKEIGAITRIQTLPWKVVYLHADFSTQLLQQEQRRLTMLVTVLVAVLVGLLAVATAQLLSKPIIKLTQTARQISAGDLEARAPEGFADEFGMLGSAFNLMTLQMRTLINQLEERVKARTQEIELQNEALLYRANQVHIVADVARRIVSSQELETFLSSITHLVSERFNYYHVGIFLLDENREYAVLRAANSEGGQRMLARNHKLAVGKVGIVGHATGAGEATIATDVGTDRIYFNNPDLPETRSEIALPLKVNGVTIGAVDIQSIEPDAFHLDDIELFTILADQIAIAIYNNQLYTETARALDEAKKMHRQYLRSEWAGETGRRKTKGYIFNQTGIKPQNQENPLWKKVFNTGEPVYAALPDDNGARQKAIMAVPISIRGETIGVIHVQEQGEGRTWAEDEIAVVNSVASQVAIALENARLFESTVRRAEREKKLLQITAKIRSTNDPEEMMQIAANELQQALLATRAQIYVRQDAHETIEQQNIPDGEEP